MTRLLRLISFIMVLTSIFGTGSASMFLHGISSRLLVKEKENVQVISAATAVAPAPKKSGGLGPILASAFCTAAIMYPVDLVRALQMANSGAVGAAKLTTVQLLSNFRAQHGLKGFFTQGLAPELARSTWMRFIKFGLFPIVHMGLHGIPEAAGNGLTKAVAAIVASVPEAMSIMPLEIAKISLQLDSSNRFKNNMLSAMSAVWKEKGLAGMTVGYVGIQYRQALWSAGYFASIKYFEAGVKDGLKLLGSTGPSSVVIGQLLSGFLAGVFGGALNCPFDTVRTVLQKRVLSAAGKVASGGPTFISIGREIVSSRGVGALYAGFGFKSLHLGGGGALMAFLIPFFKKTFAEAETKLKVAGKAQNTAKGGSAKSKAT